MEEIALVTLLFDFRSAKL